ncbi:hypothetical protein [Leucobacter sp. UCD-THU]|uniref:hypothetical protein n=1 Tax=Leucobacter sp. UCD-THU TaxID=1292023 RepID=UPI0012690791|nr:hypothetical protein [Leucobacter sp. UCD-THU]
MPVSFLVRGDPLPQTPYTDEDLEHAPSRGMLWGVDLRNCATRKAARARWHDTIQDLKHELDTHPAVLRVGIACLRPTGFPQSLLVNLPTGLASRLHNDVERDRARYLQVLVLDLTDCADLALLHDRLEEALGPGHGSWADVTLTWRDIEECGFTEAWARGAL